MKRRRLGEAEEQRGNASRATQKTRRALQAGKEGIASRRCRGEGGEPGGWGCGQRLCCEYVKGDEGDGAQTLQRRMGREEMKEGMGINVRMQCLLAVSRAGSFCSNSGMEKMPAVTCLFQGAGLKDWIEV
eukprot:1158280-Pelagomonas_calceolata.AAC.5